MRWQPKSHYRCLGGPRSPLSDKFIQFCSAPGCYYSFKVITQLKEISLMREGGGRLAGLMGPIVLLIHVSDFREGGKHFGVEHVCVCMFIYICVCVWRGGWFSQEEFGVV